jgi:hypothetical protein
MIGLARNRPLKIRYDRKDGEATTMVITVWDENDEPQTKEYPDAGAQLDVIEGAGKLGVTFNE